MKLRALQSFSGAMGSFHKGQVFEIQDIDVAQNLISSGYAVGVESCPSCGSIIEINS
ncbi:hypothetical protein [Lysinibacillus capsici]|uniref:hypothetical protein n=1 Tax=Lysinibacillus capsici TaxID=2115968 RepID=UPI002A81D191|nr:hypothetical protein [Lysinibacillus capsici]